MLQKGVREISVLDTLVYRNRNTNGLELCDEELTSWNDCIQRYDGIKVVHKQLKPSAESLIGAIASQFATTTSFAAF